MQQNKVALFAESVLFENELYVATVSKNMSNLLIYFNFSCKLNKRFLFDKYLQKVHFLKMRQRMLLYGKEGPVSVFEAGILQILDK